jgi:hypothetical protein
VCGEGETSGGGALQEKTPRTNQRAGKSGSWAKRIYFFKTSAGSPTTTTIPPRAHPATKPRHEAIAPLVVSRTLRGSARGADVSVGAAPGTHLPWVAPAASERLAAG